MALQSLDTPDRFCVTHNGTEAVDPEEIIRTIPYAHPIYGHAVGLEFRGVGAPSHPGAEAA